MNEYTPELSIVGIVGFLVPFVVSLINRPSMSSSTRRWTSVGVSVVLALIALFGVGAFTGLEVSSPQQIITVILGVLGVAQFVFTALQAAAPKVLPAIEETTTPASSTPDYGPELGVSGLESSRSVVYPDEDGPSHRAQ